jgi:rare lipoprotein A
MRLSTRNSAMALTVLCTAFLIACIAPAGAADNGGTPSGETATEAGGAGLHAKPNTILGHWLRFTGTASPNTTVAIQRLDKRNGGWVTTTTAKADAAGAYVARWRTNHIGAFSIRAIPAGAGKVRASSVDASTIRVTVFKQARATWFGPGFYGRKTACGKTMSRTLVGVAHLNLPCGTKVAFLYKGRTITVPVVDRGPYGAGASWDLTYAAAQMLGFDFTDTLGAVSLRHR